MSVEEFKKKISHGSPIFFAHCLKDVNIDGKNYLVVFNEYFSSKMFEEGLSRIDETEVVDDPRYQLRNDIKNLRDICLNLANSFPLEFWHYNGTGKSRFFKALCEPGNEIGELVEVTKHKDIWNILVIMRERIGSEYQRFVFVFKDGDEPIFE